MRNVCQVDILVGPRDKLLSPPDVAKRLFEELRGARVLSTALTGPKLVTTLLLPEVRGGYRDLPELRSFFELGLTGKGAVLVSVHGLREATSVEILDRALSKKR